MFRVMIRDKNYSTLVKKLVKTYVKMVAISNIRTKTIKFESDADFEFKFSSHFFILILYIIMLLIISFVFQTFIFTC